MFPCAYVCGCLGVYVVQGRGVRASPLAWIAALLTSHRHPPPSQIYDSCFDEIFEDDVSAKELSRYTVTAWHLPLLEGEEKPEGVLLRV